ncbi:peptidase inhibitor family I36 protein [Streptomyces sp. NPDC057889]|uniref:peptidase inhibitor family I36 protein n=1 Tax=unclassified Streptomyces TaxID=2593676 RepID=UPI0036AF525C
MIKKLALALSMALAAGLPVAGSASAAAPVTQIKGHGLDACPKQSLCLYEHSDYNGDSDAKIWVVTGSVERLSEYGANDEASSAYFNANFTSYTKLFEDAVYNPSNGDYITLQGGWKRPSLKNVSGYYDGRLGHRGTEGTVSMNDEVSSVYISFNG